MKYKILFIIAVSLMPFVSWAQLDDEDSTQNNQPTQTDMIPVTTISDSELGDNNGNDQSVSSMLSSSRDVFMGTASFILSQGGFRYRGYKSSEFITLMNGAIVNDADDGAVFWGTWGGLNDVMWNRETSVSLSRSTLAFGGLGGSNNIDTRAATLRRGLRVSFAETNRNYRHRLMATYSTGLLKGGWALAASFSRRWAEKGYEPGTNFDGYSYFFSVEKKFGSKHRLALTSYGVPTTSARAGMAVKEMQDLANCVYYNPYWGYQGGKVRSAHLSNSFQPSFILTHEAKFTNNTSLLTGAFFSFGKNSISGFDWFNSANPAPDYYRNLPSFQEDATVQSEAAALLSTNEYARQIQWDRIYDANRNSYDSVMDANGVKGNTVRGKRSKIILSNRVEDTKRFSLNSVLNHTVNEHVSLTAGVTYQWEKTRYYKEVADLLGGSFYVNINNFAYYQFPDTPSKSQYDIEKPNRILKEGDKFAYDYYSEFHKTSAFIQPFFKFNKVDFYFAGQFSNSVFWRDGLVRNGLFPNDSKGKSKQLVFYNYAVKAGLTYKINGRNYLYGNGSLMTESPVFRNVFVSPTTRSTITPNMKSQMIYSGEVGYNLTSPKIKAKLSLFYTQFKNGMETYNFFHDDFNSMVNYSLSGVDKRHYGAELGIEAKIYQGLSLRAASSFGRYQYTSRPLAYVTQDNNSKVLAENQTIYLKGYNVGGTPQSASTLGFRYMGKQYYSFGINFNYYDLIFTQPNPMRRTQDAIDLVEKNSANWGNILDQERLKGQFTMDFNASYSWMMNKNIPALNKTKHRFYININAMINNMTNNRNFVLSASEQLRFDFDEKNPYKFSTKYRYMHGIGYYVSLVFRMD